MTTASDSGPTADQRLDGELTALLYEYLFDAGHGWTIGGQRYEVAGDAQYAALGEDVSDPDGDCPLILARQSDGALFEIDLWATARRTTPEQRDAERQRFMAARERAAAAQEARGGAA